MAAIGESDGRRGTERTASFKPSRRDRQYLGLSSFFMGVGGADSNTDAASTEAESCEIWLILRELPERTFKTLTLGSEARNRGSMFLVAVVESLVSVGVG
jgi:hypothetical protein